MNFVRVSDAQFELDTISWVTPRLAVTDMNGAQTVFGEEEFFVLGDNSPVSLDSRQDTDRAIVRRPDLLGRVWRWR